MKPLVLTSIVILISATTALAQPGGNIAVYADTNAINCDLTDIGVTVCQYHIVHTFIPNGVTSSSFKIDTNHQGAYLGYLTKFPAVIGDPLTGAVVVYGECLSLPTHILTITYLCQGLTPPCGYMSVVGNPTAHPPGLKATDCSRDRVVIDAQGYTSYINNDGSCPCMSPIPVQETTWGRVKALYR